MLTYQVWANCQPGCEMQRVEVVRVDYLCTFMPSYDSEEMVMQDEYDNTVRVPYDCPVCGFRRVFVVQVVPQGVLGDLTVEP